MPSPLARTRSPDELPQPVRLSDEQMSAVFAASHPLLPYRRSDFLADNRPRESGAPRDRRWRGASRHHAGAEGLFRSAGRGAFRYGKISLGGLARRPTRAFRDLLLATAFRHRGILAIIRSKFEMNRSTNAGFRCANPALVRAALTGSLRISASNFSRFSECHTGRPNGIQT